MILHQHNSNNEILISVVVFNDDGSHKSAAFNAITLALMDAGIPMRDIIVSISAAYDNNQVIVDLVEEEQKNVANSLLLTVHGKS